MYALLFAFLSPIFYALMNVTDKTIIVRKVKDVWGYSAIVGGVNLFFAILLGSMLSWEGVTWSAIRFPMISGAIIGLSTFLYLKLLEDEDISKLVGFMYTYPIIVAILSYFFLAERIPYLGYVGAMIIIAGVLWLSVKSTRMRIGIILSIATLTLLIGLTEFFVKVATDGLTAWQGVAINQATMAIVLLCGLAHPAVRNGLKGELPNTRWALLSEIFTFASIATLFLAMEGLPATIVSSIAAIQPLFVLLFERIVDARIGTISKEHLLVPKLGAITLIVIGAILIGTHS
jgi:drug/metabolite transporter (DMT)-like permease